MNSYEGETTHYLLSAGSDRGKLKERNEDYYGIFEPETEDLMLRKGLLVAVADGMGGLLRGARASRTIVDAIGEAYFACDGDDPAGSLNQAFVKGNKKVFEHVGEGIEVKAGTTCTAAVLFENVVHLAHVGDSRAYKLGRRGAVQLTEDHSYEAGSRSSSDISGDFRPRSKRRVMTRSLGVRGEVKVDLIRNLACKRGESIFLCSDGLYSVIPPEDIAAAARGAEPAEAVKYLIKLALKRGGKDNITALMAARK